jgi:hypothetical protein
LVQALEGSFLLFSASSFILLTLRSNHTENHLTKRNGSRKTNFFTCWYVTSSLMKFFCVATNTNGWHWFIVVCCEACDWDRKTLLFWNCITQSTLDIQSFESSRFPRLGTFYSQFILKRKDWEIVKKLWMRMELFLLHWLCFLSGELQKDGIHSEQYKLQNHEECDDRIWR